MFEVGSEEWGFAVKMATAKDSMSEEEFERYREIKMSEREIKYEWDGLISFLERFKWIPGLGLKKYLNYIKELRSIDLDFLEIKYKKATDQTEESYLPPE